MAWKGLIIACIVVVSVLKGCAALSIARISEVPVLYNVDEVCSQRPLELAFILDASSSIWYQNFTKARNFVADFVDQYEIGPEKVRIGVVTYGLGVYTQDVIRLSQYNDLTSLQTAISRLPWRAGSQTDTGLAISYMRTSIMSEARPDVRRVTVVITDGNSQEPETTAEEAARARQEMEVFSVGVSDQVSHDELVRIAGNEEGVFYVNRYSELENIKGRLAMKTCTPVEPTSPPLPPPEDQPCGIKDPADVYFVFDPAALGLERTLWVTKFIKESVKTEHMKYMQVGAISGSCPLDAGFNLKQYNNSADIESHLEIFETTKLPRLIYQMADSGYDFQNGGRVGSRKVGVLFFGGKVHDSASILENVQMAEDLGIELYFANIGDGDTSLLEQLSEYGTRLDSSTEMLRQISYFLDGLCAKPKRPNWF
ncbi:hypothetical protein SNE40_003535 [Patella caerulea]|uniref:VWFA domain-containing protein n=1 Tax=Patella caerulea TaxID=87958 RepID=A0AAN8Q5E1_PATCE